jgi:hypothetical protein
VTELTAALEWIDGKRRVEVGYFDELVDAARRCAALDTEETRTAIAQALHDYGGWGVHDVTDCSNPRSWMERADGVLAVLKVSPDV